MRDLLLSTTVLASFLGGVVALLAPCCVSVMLPAYMASAFRRRSRIVAMTLVFAAGVATVILPVALGATALSRLFIEQHAWVYTIGGAAMVIAGAAVLAGWMPRLPMPGMRTPASTGVVSVYGLGAFSGVASACCAPVLAGVVAASGAVSSFPAALAVGIAYVFGMVAPLALLAVIWDRRRWDTARLVNRQLRLRLGPWRRQVPLGTAVAGFLLAAMGLERRRGLEPGRLGPGPAAGDGEPRPGGLAGRARGRRRRGERPAAVGLGRAVLAARPYPLPGRDRRGAGSGDDPLRRRQAAPGGRLTRADPGDLAAVATAPVPMLR